MVTAMSVAASNIIGALRESRFTRTSPLEIAFGIGIDSTRDR
jgi:hypothetical protein